MCALKICYRSFHGNASFLFCAATFLPPRASSFQSARPEQSIIHLLNQIFRFQSALKSPWHRWEFPCSTLVFLRFCPALPDKTVLAPTFTLNAAQSPPFHSQICFRSPLAVLLHSQVSWQALQSLTCPRGTNQPTWLILHLLTTLFLLLILRLKLGWMRVILTDYDLRLWALKTSCYHLWPL